MIISLKNNNKINNEKKEKLENKNKLVVFTKEEINILKDKKITFELLNEVKLFKNIFDCSVVS